MSDPLATYLHDHLAGSTFAVELLDSLRERYSNQELGAFAASLLVEIKADQQVVQQIADQVGKGHFDLKEATAWLAEKASRFKLNHDEPGGLGTFEALETLALGIAGKLKLWQVLPVIAGVDTRIPENGFEKLAARAQDQHDRVEEYRIKLAETAFRPVSK
jgi:hypothetical protein